MGNIQGSTHAGNKGIGFDLAPACQLIVVEIQRQLKGTGRHHKGRIINGVGLARHRIIIGKRKIPVAKAICIHKIRHHRLQVLPTEFFRYFIGRSLPAEQQDDQQDPRAFSQNTASFFRILSNRYE